MKTLLLLMSGLALAACSKVEVTVPQASVPNPAPTPQVALVSAPAAPAPMRAPDPAGRLVEIDRELSVVTSDPKDADRRAALRAERAVLVSRGTNPIIGSSSRSQPVSHAIATNRQPPPQQPGKIIVAPNSNASSLPFLEQMTPSERKRYLQAVRTENTTTIDIRHRGNGSNY